MMSRLLLLSLLAACSLPAQFSLLLVQSGQEVASLDQTYGFGSKPVGAVVNLEFHLRNTGADATLTDLHLSSPDFLFIPSAPSLPQTIASGTALDLMVQFRPSQPGPATADFIANGIKLATFNGTGMASVTVSMGNGIPVPSPLDFGSVERGKSAARSILISNSEGKDVVVNIGTRDPAFQVKGGASPIPVAAGGTLTIEVDFAPTADGPQQSALLIDQLVFPLAGTGIDPPFPPPEIDLDHANFASAQQGKLTVRLASPSQATGTGEVDMDIQPSDASANLDSGIQFPSTGTRTATFKVNQGDTVAHFGSDTSVTFQTGTTAGNIVFTVKLGYFSTTKTLPIAPAVVGVDSSKAQRTSAGLDLLLSAFDNTRSAASMTFTFFDQKGTQLPPGAITVDASAALGQFFASSDLGGAFSLHAFFPVNGNPNQVDSVEVQIVNSAGTAQSTRLPFTTP